MSELAKNCCRYAITCDSIVTFYFLDKRTTSQHHDTKKAAGDTDDIPDKIVKKYTENILNLVLYDAENCEALDHFEPVKANTHCVFAKTAKIWGSHDYDPALSLVENTLRFAYLIRHWFNV